MGFTVDILPAFTDNYIYLVGDSDLGLAMVVDPGDADVVLRALKKRDLYLSLILNTHHHKDHTGGNARLVREYGAPIIGPAKEKSRIENLARGVEKGDIVTFSTLRGHGYRDAWAYLGPYRVSLSRDRGPVLRRYAFFARLRPAVRRPGGANVAKIADPAA